MADWTISAEDRPGLPTGARLSADPEPSELEQIYRLRVLAWRDRIDFPDGFETWSDDLDPVSRHVALILEGVVVGAYRYSLHQEFDDLPDKAVFARFSEEAPPYAYASMMVVHPDHRGLGLGRLLDQDLLVRAGLAGAAIMLGSVGSVDENPGRVAAMLRAGWRRGESAPGLSDRQFKNRRAPEVLFVRYGEIAS